MSVHLVTFSDVHMMRSAALCIRSGMAHGISSYRHLMPSLLSEWPAVKANPQIFQQPADPRRAWSWWAFKPLIIEDTMQLCDEGDLVIYADAGVEFLNSVNYIIDRMDQDIFLFGNMYEHAHWCKRDIVDAVWGDHHKPWRLLEPVQGAWTHFGKQVQASVIFFRVNEKTRAFVKEWLDWCLFEGGRLIDDSPSRMPNHPEFQENRHDQAILTTLVYREGLSLHYWPASYNDGAFEYPRGDYPDEGYPILFNHHRGVKTGERAA